MSHKNVIKQKFSPPTPGQNFVCTANMNHGLAPLYVHWNYIPKGFLNCEDYFIAKHCIRGEMCRFAHSVETVKSKNLKFNILWAAPPCIESRSVGGAESLIGFEEVEGKSQ